MGLCELLHHFVLGQGMVANQKLSADKLTKVPANVCRAVVVWQLLLQKCKHFSCVCSVYISFFKESQLLWHIGVKRLDKLNNLIMSSWLLASELVTGERQDLESTRPVFIKKLR